MIIRTRNQVYDTRYYYCRTVVIHERRRISVVSVGEGEGWLNSGVVERNTRVSTLRIGGMRRFSVSSSLYTPFSYAHYMHARV